MSLVYYFLGHSVECPVGAATADQGAAGRLRLTTQRTN